MLKYLSNLFILGLILIYNTSEASSSEVEGAMRSEYLLKYKYVPLPENWEDNSIKKKSKLGCKYAFGKLGEQGKKFKCHELGEGLGSVRSIYYKVVPINSLGVESSEIPYIPSIDSIRILGWYHFRKDGKLPYYKEDVFTKNWIQLQCKSIKEDEDFNYLWIVPVVSVIDRNNDISLYVVGRSDVSLRQSSWVMNFLFSLFESPEDKLQSELCFLMQKIHLFKSPKPPKALQEKLDFIESELEKLKDEEAKENKDEE
jgi:hypothetical protein